MIAVVELHTDRFHAHPWSRYLGLALPRNALVWLEMENEAIGLERLRCHMAKEHERRTAELNGNFR
jgi:hypothetical protein